jgi:hypothetical protein
MPCRAWPCAGLHAKEATRGTPPSSASSCSRASILEGRRRQLDSRPSPLADARPWRWPPSGCAVVIPAVQMSAPSFRQASLCRSCRPETRTTSRRCCTAEGVLEFAHGSHMKLDKHTRRLYLSPSVRVARSKLFLFISLIFSVLTTWVPPCIYARTADRLNILVLLQYHDVHET